jgi:hypothetical protein
LEITRKHVVTRANEEAMRPSSRTSDRVVAPQDQGQTSSRLERHRNFYPCLANLQRGAVIYLMTAIISGVDCSANWLTCRGIACGDANLLVCSVV